MGTTVFTTDASPKPNQHSPISALQRTALTAGLFYLLTFVSIPTLALYGPIHEPNYSTGHGNHMAVIIGGLLEITVALAGIATAVVLFPVLKKQHEGLALGLVSSRVLEAATIFLGVAFLLSVVALQQKGAGEEALGISRALVTLYDRIFLLGQGFMPAINDLLLGILLYKSRIVPRSLSLIGIIGAFPLIAGYLAIMFGLIEQRSPLAGLAALMVALFEFSLGIYLIVKGFKPSAITASASL